MRSPVLPYIGHFPRQKSSENPIWLWFSYSFQSIFNISWAPNNCVCVWWMIHFNWTYRMRLLFPVYWPHCWPYLIELWPPNPGKKSHVVGLDIRVSIHVLLTYLAIARGGYLSNTAMQNIIRIFELINWLFWCFLLFLFRNFLSYLSQPKILGTNPKCTIKTHVVCNRENPTIVFDLISEVQGMVWILFFFFLIIRTNHNLGAESSFLVKSFLFLLS